MALARALFRETGLLVLDDPTAALDPKTQLALFERFAALSPGKAVLLIAHRIDVARLADRIVVLRGGRVVEDGRHDQLLRMGGEYAALYAAQARWYA